MANVILGEGARQLLRDMAAKREMEVLKLRGRLRYRGKKGRAAAKRLRRMGDWLYEYNPDDIGDFLEGLTRQMQEREKAA